MDQEVLLSICIPTFNRACALKKCLHNLTTQEGFDHSVEVVICDNASTDDTQALVTDYAGRYTNIKYYRNAENVGMEKNFVLVMQKAQGKLIKLFNDYSLMKPGTLNEIKQLIGQNADESSILYFYNFNEAPFEQTCTDFNQLLRRITYWITWIGGFSIWKSDYDRLPDKQRFEGLLFYHLLMLIENFKQKRKLKIYSKVWFDEQMNVPKGGYNILEVFINNFIVNILTKLYKQKLINNNTLIAVKGKFLKEFLFFWLKKLSTQQYNSDFVLDKKGLKSVFSNFKLYPQLYVILLKVKLKQINARKNHLTK